MKKSVFVPVDETSAGSDACGGAKPAQRNRALDERIGKIFMAIGIPPQIRGYRYLREAVKLAVQNEEAMNSVTKSLYLKVAEKYRTQASSAERAMRHAIEVAWKRIKPGTIDTVFGTRVYLGTRKPTNSEFIALVAERLLFENLI